jgi:hypothetical protein
MGGGAERPWLKSQINRLTETHDPKPHHTPHTAEGKPVTSPKTNLQIDQAQTGLVPNVAIRSLLIGYTAARTAEWEALEGARRVWAEGRGQQQEG